MVVPMPRKLKFLNFPTILNRTHNSFGQRSATLSERMVTPPTSPALPMPTCERTVRESNLPELLDLQLPRLEAEVTGCLKESTLQLNLGYKNKQTLNLPLLYYLSHSARVAQLVWRLDLSHQCWEDTQVGSEGCSSLLQPRGATPHGACWRWIWWAALPQGQQEVLTAEGGVFMLHVLFLFLKHRSRSYHLFLGTTGPCSRPGSSSSCSIRLVRSKYKAWSQRRRCSGRPGLGAGRHMGHQSVVPGSAAESWGRPAALEPGSASTWCLQQIRRKVYEYSWKTPGIF